MIQYALEYVGYGWGVFPLAGKAPKTPNGFYAAVYKEEEVKDLWRRLPGNTLTNPNLFSAPPTVVSSQTPMPTVL